MITSNNATALAGDSATTNEKTSELGGHTGNENTVRNSSDFNPLVTFLQAVCASWCVFYAGIVLGRVLGGLS